MSEAPLEKIPRGEAHPCAKLAESDILEIRRLYADGHSLRKLGHRYAVSHSQVAHIVKGRRWRHVP